MTKTRGQTLIELILFIVILGIILGAAFRVFTSVLFYSSRPAYILTASQLAEARMNLIIQQRHGSSGFAGISDPCSSGSLNACVALNTFATNNNYTVTSSIPAAVSGVQVVTVTVSGRGDAKSIMRFVQ